MEFLKRLWTGIKSVFTNTFTIIVHPFKMEMPEGSGDTMKAVTIAWNIIGGLARVLFVLSFFIAIPAIVVSFAKFYVGALAVLTAIQIVLDFGFILATGGNFASYLKAHADKVGAAVAPAVAEAL